jgi:hypothetical protein
VLGTDKARSLEEDKSVSMNETEMAALEKEYNSILQDEFGNEWEKYVVKGCFGEKSIGLAPSARDFDLGIGNDAAYQYYMRVGSYYITYPWSTWNWATTQTLRKSIGTSNTPKAVSAPQIRCYYYDSEVTPAGKNVVTGNTDMAKAVGNAKSGFFVRILKSYTEHEVWSPNFTNGHAIYAYNWGPNQ